MPDDDPRLLTPTPRPDGTFLGHCLAGAGNRVYGGQLLAHALYAAGSDLAGDLRTPSSLHGHFISPGRIDHPVRYVVRTVGRSRRFMTRQVEAQQDGRTLGLATVTFHAGENSAEHSAESPSVPPPEQCAQVPLADFGGTSAAFAPVRARVPEREHSQVVVPELLLWLRWRGELTDDPLVRAGVLTWLSDLTLTRTVDLPRQDDDGLQLRASLNHAIWFHRHLDVQDWVLAEQRSDSFAGARGIATARYFDRRGRLQASATQECLIRRAALPRSEPGHQALDVITGAGRDGEWGHAAS